MSQYALSYVSQTPAAVMDRYFSPWLWSVWQGQRSASAGSPLVGCVWDATLDQTSSDLTALASALMKLCVMDV